MTEPQRNLLRSFRLTSAQKREVWDAWQCAETGVERCALQASAYGQRHNNTGAGVLLSMIRRGEHLHVPDRSARRITGWRFSRGSHSATYVPDPRGTDPLPAGYGYDDPGKMWGDG